MNLSVAALVDRARASFFFLPVGFVVLAALAAEAMVALDGWLGVDATRIPVVVDATVDSARAVLTTVATATIGIAGIAFSVSLLLLQLAASQYSPRVVHGLFRDPYAKVVIGLVLGTFTYCLVVLRAVRDGGNAVGPAEAVVPNLAVSLAMVAGVVAILATVAFINHSAHSMDISELLHEVTSETLASAVAVWHDEAPEEDLDTSVPSGEGHIVRFLSNGWVQQVDNDALLDLVPPGGVVRLETAVGRYAAGGVPLCTVWPAPNGDAADAVDTAGRAAVRIGTTRTMFQDATYGVRQLVDVALRALSAGINDPTTAQDAIFHNVAVLRDLLSRHGPAPVVNGVEQRRLLRPEVPTPTEVIGLAFDELRGVASEQPTVCIYLLEALHLLCTSTDFPADSHADAALRSQARLVVEGCAASKPLAEDLARVERCYQTRFGVATS
ncbi:MAG: DUF2254 domain-containing protein [Acidimicrobiia bacterium]|nr:DUF2254 domain-containing protein [Acidimicrobiia bacterium]